MTVRWNCLVLSVFVLFIETVYGVQRTYVRVPTGSPCRCPYSCLTTIECARRHANQGTQEVLFQCGERGKICCPPVRHAFTVPVAEKGTNSYGFGDDCIEDGYQQDEGGSLVATTQPSPARTSTVRSYFHVPSGVYVHTDEILESQQKQHKSESAKPPSNPQKPPSNGRKPQPPPQNAPKTKNSLSSHKNFRLLPSESHCGVNNFANRITEGEEVSLGEYPWMVLTGVKGKFSANHLDDGYDTFAHTVPNVTDRYGNYRWNCGGTLINGWYVLTAAHCLFVDNRTIEYVRLGEHNLTNETDCSREICLDRPEDVPISQVVPHEKWNTTTIKNDIALVRLSRNPLLLGKSNIYPICLPFDIKKLNVTPTSKFEVAGWGKTDWNADEGSDVLRKASISGVSQEECNICKDRKKQQYCPITDTQLCVQGWKAVDVCKGDSGGPLMVLRLNTYQVGITSFKGSEYCGAENIPSIFTKVESYLSWILDNIRE
ncbi:hypothetical protein RUM44_001160 [Polyplax serrata]|uniref:Peptidase S1 domain-containing protein n=1 Tax=Polyplax serrata TaxID=468196 RepID=A0ABR1B7R2_POLSC